MKNKIITFTFIIFLLGFSILNLILPDKEVSVVERRRLTAFPVISLNTVFNKTAIDQFEKYTLDQFPFRDSFLKAKTYIDYNILGKLSINDLFSNEGYIYKLDYHLNEKEVLNFSNKLNSLCKDKLQGNKVYYSVIPDKNYFLDENKHLKIDYEKILSILDKNIKNINYIKIIDKLSIEDYYFTDIHWKQENLIKIVDELSMAMNFNYKNNFTIKREYYPFYGSYYENGFPGINADTLKYLTNSSIENALVTNYSNNNDSKIYNEEKLGSIDSYDVFLDGATPFIEIVNTNPSSEKELIIFRDSFGSSLAPLLIESYSKVTLIDIRYISSSKLNELIEFNSQDVLFIYNISIINNASMLK